MRFVTERGPVGIGRSGQHPTLRSAWPVTILPEDVYDRRAELVDVTAIGDAYRKFLDPVTGKVYDGAEYARKLDELNF